jgi:cysteine protease ATG4
MRLRDNIPVLVLVPVMLGPRMLDQTYLPFVKICLSIPMLSLGIVGGQQGKAFFLIGYRDDTFLFFDPHVTYDAVARGDDQQRLHEPKLKEMKATELNSSMLVAFLIGSQKDLEEIPKCTEPLGNCPFSVVDWLPSELDHTTELPDDKEGGWEVVTDEGGLQGL